MTIRPGAFGCNVWIKDAAALYGIIFQPLDHGTPHNRDGEIEREAGCFRIQGDRYGKIKIANLPEHPTGPIQALQRATAVAMHVFLRPCVVY
jgi:hypothetical protein